MNRPLMPGLPRRLVLRSWLAVSAAAVLAACGGAAGGGATPPTGAATSAPAAPTLAPTAPPPTATVAATARPATPATPAAPLPTTPPSLATVAPAAVAVAPTTPACASAEPTLAQTEGPYFKANAPQRVSLLTAGLGGTKLTLSGRVLGTTCQPVARARLDFWQADDKGAYDNSGFTLRGHQFTDEAGRYQLETILPGLYPGRTRHIHVKVQPPTGPALTTQLYFTGEPGNARDNIFNPKLAMTLQDANGGKMGAFDFILR